MEVAQGSVSLLVKGGRLVVARGEVVGCSILVTLLHGKVNLFQPGEVLEPLIDAGEDGIGGLRFAHDRKRSGLAMGHDDGGPIGFDHVQQLPGHVAVLFPAGLQDLRVKGPPAGGVQKDRLVLNAQLPQGAEALLLPAPVVGVHVHNLHRHAPLRQGRQQPSEAGELLPRIGDDQHDGGLLQRRLESGQLLRQLADREGGQLRDGALLFEGQREPANALLGRGVILVPQGRGKVRFGHGLIFPVQPGDLHGGGDLLPPDIGVSHLLTAGQGHGLRLFIRHIGAVDAVVQPVGVVGVLLVPDGQHFPEIDRFLFGRGSRKDGIGRQDQYR